jgi:broad specificity phosphatase PhoE
VEALGYTGLPKRLVLIRHGESLRNMVKRGAIFLTEEGRETTGRINDINNPLTEEGHRQSRLTGEALRERFGVPDCVYHSGYARTIGTADSILEAYSADERARIAVRQHIFLRERDNGYAYNMTAEEAEQAFPWLQEHWRIYSNFFVRPPGGESMAEVAQRVYLFLGELSRCQVGETVFVVIHSGSMRCLRYWIEGWTPADFEAAAIPPNCAVTSYRYDEGESGRGFVLEMGNSVLW